MALVIFSSVINCNHVYKAANFSNYNHTHCTKLNNLNFLNLKNLRSKQIRKNETYVIENECF